MALVKRPFNRNPIHLRFSLPHDKHDCQPEEQRILKPCHFIMLKILHLRCRLTGRTIFMRPKCLIKRRSGKDLFLRTDFLHAGPAGIAVMLLVGVRNGGFFSFFPGCKAGAVPAFQAVHTVGAEHVIRFIGGAGIGLRMVPHGGGVDTQYGAHKTEEQGGENSAVNTLCFWVHVIAT